MKGVHIGGEVNTMIADHVVEISPVHDQGKVRCKPLKIG